MDPLASCEDCFARGKPDLCEMIRNCFVQIKEMHPLKRQLLERVLIRSRTDAGPVGRFWGFAVTSEQRKGIVQQLRDIGVTIHTLEDHVESLQSRYGPGIRKLGPPVYVSLPFGGAWSEFDPKKRLWKRLYTYRKGTDISTTTKSGAVLKCSNRQGDAYFVVFTSVDNKRSVQRVRKVAAYDIIGRMFEPSQAFWIPFPEKGVAMIQISYLPNIPDLVFNTLVRFKPDEGHIEGALVFGIDDFDLIKEVLSWIKTDLVKSSEVLKLPGDKDKLHGTPVMHIDQLKNPDIGGGRLPSLLQMFSDMGAQVQEQHDHLLVSGSRGSAKLYFVEKERSHTEGATVYITLQVMSDPSKVSELLQMLQYKLGLQAAEVEKVVIGNWPLITPSDMDYIIDCIDKIWEHQKNLIPTIINTQGRAERLRGWLNEVKAGTARADPNKVYLVEKALKQSGVL